MRLLDDFDDFIYYFGTDSLILSVILGIFLFVFIFVAVFYVVSAIFMMKVLKRAAYVRPAAAWIPIWNTAALYELAGIKQPWAWVAMPLGISFVFSSLGMIPFVGVALMMPVMMILTVVSIMLTVWAARGVQAGLGINSTGGIVLAVLVPVAWLIWMGVKADRAAYYNHPAAFSQGSTFPMNFFGDSDQYQSFMVARPVYSHTEQAGYTENHGQENPGSL